LLDARFGGYAVNVGCGGWALYKPCAVKIVIGGVRQKII
jgi:hypothetical protein